MELNEKHLKKHFEQLVQCTNLQKVNEILNQYLTQNGNVSIMDYLQTLISDDTSNDKIIISLAKNEIEKSIQLLSTLTQSTLNKLNMSGDSFRKEVDEIVDLNQENSELEQFLINVVKLTKRNKQLIRVASNFLHLLVRMNIQLFYEDFSYIEIEDTNISQGNLAGCNLDYSKFTNVNISGVNLNGASLKNAKWLNLKTFEQNIIKEKNSIDKLSLLTRNILVSFCKSISQFRIIEYLSGKLIRMLQCTRDITSFAGSTKGLLAFGSNKIYLVNAQTGKCIRKIGQLKLEGRNQSNQLEFSKDCSLLASLDYHQIIIWKCKSWQICRIINHSDAICLSISENSKYVISDMCNESTKSVVVWNIETGDLVRKYKQFYDDIQTILYDTQYIVAGTHDPEIQVFDCNSNEFINLIFPRYGTTSIAILKQLNILATGCYDRNIYIWSLSNFNLITIINGHLNKINFLTFSENGKYLISCSDDTTIRIWNMETILSFKNNIKQNSYFDFYAISNDEKQLFILKKSTLTVNQMQDKKGNLIQTTRKILKRFHYNQQLDSIKLSNNNRYLLIGGGSKIFIMSLTSEAYSLEEIETKMLNFSVAFLNNQLAITIGAYYIKIFSVNSYKEIQRFQYSNNDNYCTFLQISNNNKIIVTVLENVIRFWQKNKVLFEIHQGTTTIQFSTSGRYLLLSSSNYDSSLKIWKMGTRTIISSLVGHQSQTISAQFTPNDKIVITGNGDQTLRFWDISNGSQLAIIRYNGDYKINLLITNHNLNCKLYINQLGSFSIWNLGDCNVECFKPICYKVFSRWMPELSADYSILTGAEFRNSDNIKIKQVFEFKSRQLENKII